MYLNIQTQLLLRNENLKTFTLRSRNCKMPSLTTFNKVLNAKPEQLDETKNKSH